MHNVGDRVRLKRDIWEEPTGDSPGGLLGKRGETVIVKRCSDLTTFRYSVAHDGADGSFGVNDDEIE